jgi:uncharacterized protein YjbI with pentapeptide repeats
MRRFTLLVVAVTLLSGSTVQAASYQKTNGTIVDPIVSFDNHNTHSYSGPNLEPHANLIGADLYYAELDYADLTGANLEGANLSNAGLRDAYLTYATLTYADLTNTTLTYAYLTYAELGGANLTHANLHAATLTGADLTNADLTYADLTYATLTHATLTHATLTNADLYGVNMYYANLSAATLTGADLGDTNLGDVDLSGADLYGADLTNAAYVDTTIGSPYYYANTTLPAGFDPVAKGWTLSPYCDFTLDAACDLVDLNQMFEAGDLATGVGVSEHLTGARHKLDLIPNDTVDAGDISEWLSVAATAHGHGSPYFRGDTDLDRDVDLRDYNALAGNFNPIGADGPYLWQHGNSDGDNDIDLTDYNALAANFSPIGYGAAAVPEPASLCLLLTALLVLARVRF